MLRSTDGKASLKKKERKKPNYASLGKQFARPYLEKTLHKKRAYRVAQGVVPGFKPQYCKKKKKKYTH
jgi:hypothetical protein